MQGYEYCECAKEYLSERLRTAMLDDRVLAERTGYADIDKFRRHQNAWHALERPIPRRYLAAIGAELEVLREALERDQVNFQLMDALPRTPDGYTIRFMPGMYRLRFFEGPVPEEEAIRRIRAFTMETGLRCFIKYPKFLMVYIEADGSVVKKYYRPSMKITDNWVAFERAATRVEAAKTG